MSHPEGRVLAVQQQMFLARVLDEKWGVGEELILRKLSLTGLKLALDVEEIAVDAAAILPKLSDTHMMPKLHAVPKGEE